MNLKDTQNFLFKMKIYRKNKMSIENQIQNIENQYKDLNLLARIVDYSDNIKCNFNIFLVAISLYVLATYLGGGYAEI